MVRIGWRAALLIIIVLRVLGASGCGPGRGAGRRRGPRKLTPLVFKQHVPNVPENTLTASGLTEGRIGRNDTRFKDLVPNYNNDIIFKDEEGTGADRLMTQRCKEKLNTLAISVMNQWPGTKLLVTEGWDEEEDHSIDSLHYEGRAVDITTDDRDRQKYGMLARLAVEAGFDWVYYESRAHIHCSVKSESTHAKSLGCFPGDATVVTSQGTALLLADLKIGDRIASWDFATNRIVSSEVLQFLDHAPNDTRKFLHISFESAASIYVTGSHLIYSARESSYVFAERLTIGDVMRTQNGGLETIASVKVVRKKGVYAPLTRTGNMFVNGVLVSCYAAIEDQKLAHLSFAPVRYAHNIQSGLDRLWTLLSNPVIGWSDARSVRASLPQDGVHWYAAMLYSVADYVMPERVHR